MITDKGKSLIADYIVSTFVKGDVGSGGNTTNPAQLELDVPLLTTKATVIPVKSDESVIDFKMTIQGSTANISGRSLRECGIFNGGSCTLGGAYTSSSACTDAGGSWVAVPDMLTRFNFDAIGPFSSSEEVEFFIAVEVE